MLNSIMFSSTTIIDIVNFYHAFIHLCNNPNIGEEIIYKLTSHLSNIKTLK